MADGREPPETPQECMVELVGPCSHCLFCLSTTQLCVDTMQSARGRLARALLWLLLALSIPYALMMGATGVFFGLGPPRILL